MAASARRPDAAVIATNPVTFLHRIESLLSSPFSRLSPGKDQPDFTVGGADIAQSTMHRGIVRSTARVPPMSTTASAFEPRRQTFRTPDGILPKLRESHPGSP